jgi:D-alanyl-lipoteichoic acid acyltransferase DltB (MBOAT superfamily)
MLFPTFTFFLFFAIILILNWTLKKRPLWWRIFLLLSSYIFYATINVRFVLLIFIVSLINFYSGLLIHRSDQETKRKILLGVTVGINILILGFFKYYGFFREGMQALLDKFGISSNFLLLNVILPVGLSFYILRAISYNVDIYRKKINPESSFLDLAIYIAFFPQLLAGPIMRPDEFLPQLKNGGAKTIENLQENFAFILSGLFKKIVIVSYLTVNIVDDVFAVPQNHSQLAVLLAIYAYAIVIYCDFSGYSDLAIGIAGLMGFKSPANFNAPYLAIDFRDFWRRWHITFSNWLRDYVYIPLGGNRKGEIRTYFNLVITMLISGLWHGTGLNFVFWGFLHGLGLIASRIREKFGVGFRGFLEKFEKTLSWFITFNAVCFFWIFFRAESVSGAFAVIKQLFNFRTGVEPVAVYTIFFIVLSFLIFALGKKIKELFIKIEEKLPLALQIIFISILIVIIVELGPDIIPPFIYFQF